MAWLAATATAAFGPCDSSLGGNGADGGTAGGDPVAIRCAALCSATVAEGCAGDENGCRASCEQRFGAPGCGTTGTALLDCYAQQGLSGCELPAACDVEAARYAACRGALACTDTLSCEPLSPGCECSTDCAGFDIVANCNPQDGHCTCTIDGPMGLADDDMLVTECVSASPTNKWCLSQPFGCCEELF